jgi:ADP-ribose pyrophosphatase YjhB (NUDIX family)
MGAYPHFTVSFLPYDPVSRQGLLIYRGERVRSVKNCYAIPSGLLEHGESFTDCIVREMQEEIGVSYDHGTDGPINFHAIYRNIPGDGYDWVIGIWSVAIRGLDTRASNAEPDKHDFILVQDFESLRAITRHCLSGTCKEMAPNLAGPLFGVLTELMQSQQGQLI